MKTCFPQGVDTADYVDGAANLRVETHRSVAIVKRDSRRALLLRDQWEMNLVFHRRVGWGLVVCGNTDRLLLIEGHG